MDKKVKPWKPPRRGNYKLNLHTITQLSTWQGYSFLPIYIPLDPTIYPSTYLPRTDHMVGWCWFGPRCPLREQVGASGETRGGKVKSKSSQEYWASRVTHTLVFPVHLGQPGSHPLRTRRLGRVSATLEPWPKNNREELTWLAIDWLIVIVNLSFFSDSSPFTFLRIYNINILFTFVI